MQTAAKFTTFSARINSVAVKLTKVEASVAWQIMGTSQVHGNGSAKTRQTLETQQNKQVSGAERRAQGLKLRSARGNDGLRGDGRLNRRKNGSKSGTRIFFARIGILVFRCNFLDKDTTNRVETPCVLILNATQRKQGDREWGLG